MPGFAAFVPDDWSATRKTERKFFYAVLAHLTPGYVQALVRRARVLRGNRTGKAVIKAKQITVTPFWQKQMTSIPFRSGKSPPEFAHYLLFSKRKIQ